MRQLRHNLARRLDRRTGGLEIKHKREIVLTDLDRRTGGLEI